MLLQRHAHLPGTRKYLGILNCDFVIDGFRAPRSEPLNDMECITVKISRAIEPAEIVEPLGVDDQRLPVPPAVRPSHPAVRGRVGLVGHIDRADRSGELVNEHDVLRALNDLERHALIRRARYTRQVALDLRIEFQPVRVVLLLLLARGWQIRDLAAFDDTESGRHSSSGPELAHRTHARWMRLDVPV